MANFQLIHYFTHLQGSSVTQMTDSLRHNHLATAVAAAVTAEAQANKCSHSMPFHGPILGVYLCKRQLCTRSPLAFLSGREYAWVDSRFLSLGLHPLQREKERESAMLVSFTYYLPTCAWVHTWDDLWRKKKQKSAARVKVADRTFFSHSRSFLRDWGLLKTLGPNYHSYFINQIHRHMHLP